MFILVVLSSVENREILSIFVKSLELGKFYLNLFNFLFLSFNSFHLHYEFKLQLTLLLYRNPNLESRKNNNKNNNKTKLRSNHKPILFITYHSYCVFLICIRCVLTYLYFSRSLVCPFLLFLLLKKVFSIFSHIFSLIGKVSAFEAASYWFKSIKVSNFLIFISFFKVCFLTEGT